MTNIRLTIDLELPDLPGVSDMELQQILHDQYVHYVVKCHARDGLHWSLTEPESIITTVHMNWMDYAEPVSWSWARVPASVKGKA